MRYISFGDAYKIRKIGLIRTVFDKISGVSDEPKLVLLGRIETGCGVDLRLEIGDGEIVSARAARRKELATALLSQ